MARYVDIDKAVEFLSISCKNEVLLKQMCDILNGMSTADVVPREEFDNLKVELTAMRSAANSYKMHYQNIAKEIFEEIDKILSDDVKTTYDCNGNAYHKVYFEDLIEDVAELRKKYMEGKFDG